MKSDSLLPQLDFSLLKSLVLVIPMPRDCWQGTHAEGGKSNLRNGPRNRLQMRPLLSLKQGPFLPQRVDFRMDLLDEQFTTKLFPLEVLQRTGAVRRLGRPKPTGRGMLLTLTTVMVH